MLPGARFTLNLFYQYELILPKLAASVQPGGTVTYVKLYILEGSLFLARIFWSAPIPVAKWSKARVCGRSPAGIAGCNPAGGMDVCLL